MTVLLPLRRRVARRIARCSLRALALVATTVLAACSGGGDGPPTTPPGGGGGTLSLVLATASGTVVAGESTSLGVTISRGGSFSGAVALSVEGAPAGVTASFGQASLGSGATGTTLSIQVGGAVAAGSYPLTVRAAGSGVSAATASYALTVTAAPVPDFTLTSASSTVTLAPGAQTTAQLTIARTGGFTGAVALTLTGAPTGVTGTFAPASVTGTSSTLTLTVGAAVPAGTYALTVRANGTGVAERTAAVTLTVSATPTPTLGVTSATSAVTVTQAQQSAAIALVLTRGGGLTGDITLALEGAPAGVTGAFTPNPATGASSQLTISVGAAVAAGTYPLTVRGTAGATSGTFAIALTVTAASAGSFALAVVPSAVTVVQGQTGLSTVNIARTGGFSGTVNLTVTGLPAGVTATFTPAAATGPQAQLALVVGAGVTPGTYALTVRGNATAIAEQTVALSLTVQSSGTTGGGNVVWRFCDTDRFPVWFAYQDGTSGAWTRVTAGANQTYSFNISQNVGGVAFVDPDNGGGPLVTVFYFTRAELTALGLAECTMNALNKTVNTSVAGLGALQRADVHLGTGSASVSVNGPVAITGVDDGSTDLLASRSVLDIGTLSQTPDRFILRRNLNPAAGSTLPLLDFASAEAFAPATATYSIANAGGDMLRVLTGFTTARGSTGFFTFGPFTGGGATRTVYGIPFARTDAGDLHQVFVTALTGTTSVRTAMLNNRELADRTVTLGATLTAPTISTLASAPYARLRAAGTFQADYADAVGVSFTQSTGSGRSWSVNASRSYFNNAGSYELTIPDVTADGGFDTSAWGLGAGITTQWAVSASGSQGGTPGVVTENYLFRSGSRTGDVTP